MVAQSTSSFPYIILWLYHVVIFILHISSSIIVVVVGVISSTVQDLVHQCSRTWVLSYDVPFIFFCTSVCLICLKWTLISVEGFNKCCICLPHEDGFWYQSSVIMLLLICSSKQFKGISRNSSMHCVGSIASRISTNFFIEFLRITIPRIVHQVLCQNWTKLYMI